MFVSKQIERPLRNRVAHDRLERSDVYDPAVALDLLGDME